MTDVDPPQGIPDIAGQARAVRSREALTATVKSGAGLVWSSITPRRAVGTIAVALIGLIVLSEWNRDPVVDVAKAWNDSIERLGIRPVFPPQEDFHVGDVYAVLKLNRPNDRQRLNPSHAALVNKAIRVGHIDLLADILKIDARRPHYGSALLTASANAAAGTSPAPVATRERSIVVRTLAGAELPLRVMMFPGIRISVDQGLSFGGLLERITGRAQWTRAEQMVIDKPRTYGIEPEWAAAALLGYCRDRERQPLLHCSEDHLRYLLSLQYGREACERWTGGEPIFRIEVFVVSRVYVSDSIDAGITNVRSAAFGRDLPPKKPPSGAVEEPPAPAAAPAGDEAGQGEGRKDLSAESTFGLRIHHAGRLDAPAAFGFQATTIQAFPNPNLRAISCPET